MSLDRDRISLLLERGALTREQLAECEEACARSGETDVLRALLAKGYVDRAEIDALATETVTSIPETVTHPGQATRKVERPPRDRIGGFQLQAVLGAGGMGMVCRAVDPKLSRTVAVKIVKVGESGIMRERVLREARTAGRLRHPGIVQVHDVGEEDGHVYIAMDCIEGRSMRDWIESQADRRDLREAVRLLREVAHAIEFAHRAGVVHRDLKPENILLDAQGRPYVGDFGLAKELGSETMLTVSGMVMGTPAFMAPEQAEGHVSEIGPATDIYALGGVLYQCLTGRTPFEAASVPELLYKVVHDEPVAPTRLNDRVPRDLEVICLKCLAKERPRRYATAAALAEDLDRFLAGEAILARPPSFAWRIRRQFLRRRSAIVLGGLLLVALVIGLSAQSGKRQAEQRLEDERIVVACTEEVESIVYLLETWGRRKEDRESGVEGMRHQMTRAEELLAKARALLPDHPALLVAHARFALATDREEEALALLDRARQHGGEGLRLYPLVRGQALLSVYGGRKPKPAIYLTSEFGQDEPLLLMEPAPPDSPEVARIGEESAREFERYLARDGGDPRARRARVALAFLSGSFGRVEEVYRSEAEADAALRWDGEAMTVVARALYLSAYDLPREARRVALGRALELLRSITPVAGASRHLELLLGETLMGLGRFQEAVDVLTVAHRAMPDDRVLLLERTRGLAALGRWKSIRGEAGGDELTAAEQGFAGLLERDPKDVGAAQGLANALLYRGWDEDQHGKDPRESYRKAIQAIDKALSVAGRADPSLLSNRGAIHMGTAMWELAHGEDASSSLRSAAKSFREGLAGGVRGLRSLDGLGFALGELGGVRMRAGEDPTAELREALSAFEESLSRSPSDSFAAAHRAVVLRRLGDWGWEQRSDDGGMWESALVSAEQALASNPKYYLPWSVRGAVHLSRAQALARRRESTEAEFELARKAYGESLALYPRDASARVNLGAALSALGDCRSRRGEEGRDLYQAAVEQYDAAIAIGYPDGLVHRQRAYALEVLGRPEEAIRGYEEALRLDPKDEQTRKRLEAIQTEQAERAPVVAKMRAAAERAGGARAAGDRGREREAWCSALEAWGARAFVSYEEQVLLVEAHLGLASACAAIARSAGTTEAASFRDEAFHHLGKALDLGFSDRAGLEGKADFAELHADARWGRLLERFRR